MEYFVISDIHGYYDVMRASLDKHGYDSTNPNHHLLVLGDMFDRGHQSKQVLEYLYPLAKDNKATVLLGNHDTFLIELLEGDYDRAYFNMMHNGFDQTLLSLTNIEPLYTNLPDIREYIFEHYPCLFHWLMSLPAYLELGDYIFVHGGIDGGKPDWKTMSSKRDFVWGREYNLPPIKGKTVVAGHTRVATIHKYTSDYHQLYLDQPELFDTLYLDGKIMIDRFVEVSQELNVLQLTI